MRFLHIILIFLYFSCDNNNSDLIERAVKGMLPKNKLGSVIFKNLRVYDDENHNQSSQNPKQININEF